METDTSFLYLNICNYLFLYAFLVLGTTRHPAAAVGAVVHVALVIRERYFIGYCMYENVCSFYLPWSLAFRL